MQDFTAASHLIITVTAYWQALRYSPRKDYRIGTLRYNWPMRHRPSACRLYRFGRFTLAVLARVV